MSFVPLYKRIWKKIQFISYFSRTLTRSFDVPRFELLNRVREPWIFPPHINWLLISKIKCSLTYGRPCRFCEKTIRIIEQNIFKLNKMFQTPWLYCIYYQQQKAKLRPICKGQHKVSQSLKSNTLLRCFKHTFQWFWILHKFTLLASKIKVSEKC